MNEFGETDYVTDLLNSNIRCIEIVAQAEIAENANTLNSNIRCIEMREKHCFCSCGYS